MPKTVVINLVVWGANAVETTNYIPETGQVIQQTAYLNDNAIQDFKNRIPAMKAQTIARVKPMLAAGGFIYGADLWKWSTELYHIYCKLWLTLTFEDTNGVGRAAFMKMISDTGLLEFEYRIVKNYG